MDNNLRDKIKSITDDKETIQKINATIRQRENEVKILMVEQGMADCLEIKWERFMPRTGRRIR